MYSCTALGLCDGSTADASLPLRRPVGLLMSHCIKARLKVSDDGPEEAETIHRGAGRRYNKATSAGRGAENNEGNEDLQLINHHCLNKLT